MGKIEACIFDMDGTLADNMSYHQQSWGKLIEKYALKLTKQEFSALSHGTVVEIVGRMFPSKSPEEIIAIGEEKEQFYRELYRPFLNPLPGLLPFLQSLKQANIPMSMATMGDKKNQAFMLEAFGMLPFFSIIVGGEDVEKGKPDPEVFLKTAEQMNKPPANCIVFEDSASGIEAAKRAGMRVVALSTTHTAAQLEKYTPDHIMADYSACNLSLLKNLMTT